MVLLFHNNHGKFQKNKIWNRSDNRSVDNARTQLHSVFFFFFFWGGEGGGEGRGGSSWWVGGEVLLKNQTIVLCISEQSVIEATMDLYIFP